MILVQVLSCVQNEKQQDRPYKNTTTHADDISSGKLSSRGGGSKITIRVTIVEVASTRKKKKIENKTNKQNNNRERTALTSKNKKALKETRCSCREGGEGTDLNAIRGRLRQTIEGRVRQQPHKVEGPRQVVHRILAGLDRPSCALGAQVVVQRPGQLRLHREGLVQKLLEEVFLGLVDEDAGDGVVVELGTSGAPNHLSFTKLKQQKKSAVSFDRLSG